MIYQKFAISINSWKEGDSINECLILGSYPQIQTDKYADDVFLGSLISKDNYGFGCDAVIAAKGYDLLLYDFYAFYGSYKYRIGGQYDGDGHIRYASSSEIINVWNCAGRSTR